MKLATGPTSSEWHIITCEYPPRVGGVSDYTFTLAASLASTHPVHVWCAPAAGPVPEAPGVVIHPELNRFAPHDLWRVGARLNAWPGPRRLFVQWVPQGFGYRSVNIWFPIWLAIRAWVRGDELHLMIHEPFLPWSPDPLRFGAALLHRLMLAIATSGAAYIWLSAATWESRIRPYAPRRTPITWLPVPAPSLFTKTGARSGVRQTPGTVQPGLLVGHFGTHSSLVTRALAPALDVILRDSAAHVILIGRDSDTFRQAFLQTRPQVAGRVRATGVLAPEAVAQHLVACDLMIQPYPDGLTSRRTSTLTLLALELPVVTNAGHLTESFWSDCGAVHLVTSPDGVRIGEAAVRLLKDRAGRAALAARGREMYDESFDTRHAVALLEAAAWPHTDGDVEIRADNAAHRRA